VPRDRGRRFEAKATLQPVASHTMGRTRAAAALPSVIGGAVGIDGGIVRPSASARRGSDLS
jgi:hypothetical protein